MRSPCQSRLNRSKEKLSLWNRHLGGNEHQPTGEIGEIHPNAQTVWRKMPQCRLGDGCFKRYAGFMEFLALRLR